MQYAPTQYLFQTSIFVPARSPDLAGEIGGTCRVRGPDKHLKDRNLEYKALPFYGITGCPPGRAGNL